MPRQKGGGKSFGISYDAPEIQEAASEFGHAMMLHIPDEVRERIQYLRDEGYEVIADEIYDAYTEEAG